MSNRRKYQSLDREKRAGIRQVSQMRRAESESARRRKSAEEIRGPWEENAPSEFCREIARETGAVYHPSEQSYDRRPPRSNDTVYDPSRGRFGRRRLDPVDNEMYLRELGASEDVVVPNATMVSDEEWTAARNRRIEQEFARYLYGVRPPERPVGKEE